MKSWLYFLLPKDEYKEKKMLYFFAESGVLLFLSLIMMMIFNQYFSLSADVILLIAIPLFAFYVFLRYILSGMEYTDVTTEQVYKRETKKIVVNACSYAVIVMLAYFVIDGIPNGQNEWFTVIGFVLLSGILYFFTSFISLRRSYNKNKKLL